LTKIAPNIKCDKLNKFIKYFFLKYYAYFEFFIHLLALLQYSGYKIQGSCYIPFDSSRRAESNGTKIMSRTLPVQKLWPHENRKSEGSPLWV